MMNKKGFTLVELMVVIVIIGVLAAVAIPKFSAATNKAKASEMPNVMSQIKSAQDVYYTETNYWAGDATHAVANMVGGLASDGLSTLNGADATLQTHLGVDASGAKYFHYIVNATANADGATKTYTIQANVVKDLGKLLSSGSNTFTETINNDATANTAVFAGSNTADFENYVRSYKSNLKL